jgi:hypothetical protein
MTAIITTRAMSPRQRQLCFIGLGLVAVAALALGMAKFQSWKEERDWQEACAEADRLDPGWRYEDLVAGEVQIPNEQNSVTRVQKAMNLLALAKSRVTQIGRRLQSLPQHRLSAKTVEARVSVRL